MLQVSRGDKKVKVIGSKSNPPFYKIWSQNPTYTFAFNSHQMVHEKFNFNIFLVNELCYLHWISFSKTNYVNFTTFTP